MNMGVVTESLKQSRGRILGRNWRNWDKSSQSPPQSTHKVAMSDFWRTFHHDGKISPGL
jgi:hypothetical protein